VTGSCVNKVTIKPIIQSKTNLQVTQASPLHVTVSSSEMYANFYQIIRYHIWEDTILLIELFAYTLGHELQVLHWLGHSSPFGVICCRLYQLNHWPINRNAYGFRIKHVVEPNLTWSSVQLNPARICMQY
jgi:hypothetical protein